MNEKAMVLFKSLVILALIAAIVTPVVLVWSSQQSDPVVLTRLGVVRGMRATDGDYDMFLGIPYASINESNAFGASIPYPPFEATFEAIHDSDPCPQVQTGVALGSLNCLHLNVYVPLEASYVNPLPVLVFIYGGHFMHGFGNKYKYGPKYLVRHGVILVTFNYRINAYGFMCLQTPEVPGNQGLKDQLAAIRWVKNNIAAFGGDPNKITLFGESSGAVSVDLHLLYSPEALFKQIITESGNSLCPWAVDDPDKMAAFKLAKHLGFVTDDLTEAIAFLSKHNSDRVVEAVEALNLMFSPCVEKEIPGVYGFITKHPITTAIPRAERTPIISGYNSDEALVMMANMTPEVLAKMDWFQDKLSKAFEFGDKLKQMGDYVRHFYIGDEDINITLRREVTDFKSDIIFATPTQRSVQKYLKFGAKSVHHYVFSYTGERNIAGITIKRNLSIDGAAHADELGYLFDMPDVPGEISPADKLILDRMTTLWTNFAKYGNPTPESSILLPIKWSPATNTKLNYLKIDTEMSMGTRPFRERQAFWEYFYDSNKEYVRGYR